MVGVGSLRWRSVPAWRSIQVVVLTVNAALRVFIFRVLRFERWGFDGEFVRSEGDGVVVLLPYFRPSASSHGNLTALFYRQK